MKKSTAIFNYEKFPDFWRIFNYIVVSDSDNSYIPKDKIRIAKILKLIYLVFAISIIFLSFIPLFFEPKAVINNNKLSLIFNYIVCIFLLIDYAFRWITFPIRIEDKRFAILFFPFTGVSFLMFFSLLPSLIIVFFPATLNDTSNETSILFIQIVNSLIFLRLGRLILFLNVLTPFRSIKNVFAKQRVLLFNIFIFLIIISILFALIVFQAEITDENSKIKSYWDALYFTIISLTTIGYGDISPVTSLGQSMVVILAIIGVALFTIPAGVIAGGFLQELQENAKKEKVKTKKSTFLQKIIFKSADNLKRISEYTSRSTKKNKEKNIKDKD